MTNISKLLHVFFQSHSNLHMSAYWYIIVAYCIVLTKGGWLNLCQVHYINNGVRVKPNFLTALSRGFGYS